MVPRERNPVGERGLGEPRTPMTEPETAAPRPKSPATTFDDLPLDPRLRLGVRAMGYTTPTPIQDRTIPPAVLGRDLVGTAQTGTGKTAAFLLPTLERLLELPPGRIYALVLTPTRELALQAQEFVRQLGHHTRVRGAAVYGGVGMLEQERALRGRAEIIVATPGRLLDHMSRGYVDFSSLRILVLDEGDRMLDMGFLPDVRRILRSIPAQRQTMLFSATMPPEVVRLAHDYLRDPKMVQVDPTTVAAVGVSHIALPVPSTRKTDLLVELLQDATMSSVLVFVRTKHRADRLVDQLVHRGFDAGVLHGGRSQSQRVRALDGFRRGAHRLLVATDLAARGLDVEGVSHVINYDVPHEPEVYIHRVGRTARAQRQGDAMTLVSPEEEGDLARIERLLGNKIPRSQIPGFDLTAPPTAAPGRPPFRGGGRPDRGRPSRGGPPPRSGRHDDRRGGRYPPRRARW
jgi:ATP-dependent RNA helicase RhlE